MQTDTETAASARLSDREGCDTLLSVDRMRSKSVCTGNNFIDTRGGFKVIKGNSLESQRRHLSTSEEKFLAALAKLYDFTRSLLLIAGF